MDKFIRFSCAALLCLVFASGVSAQANTAPPASTVSPALVDETTLLLPDAAAAQGTAAGTGQSSMLPYFLRMILVLGLVIAAIYGLYALLKRGSRPAKPADSYLRVLASTTIGVGRSLHVVSLGDKAWLIGSTESSIGLISEIENKELVDALELRAAEGPQTPRKDFSSLLGDMLGRKDLRKVSSADSGEFFNRQRDRLKKF